jgi:hypothetical protein
MAVFTRSSQRGAGVLEAAPLSATQSCGTASSRVGRTALSERGFTGVKRRSGLVVQFRGFILLSE